MRTDVCRYRRTADHFDAPEASEVDKTADIAGLFAWTDSDAERVNLIMTVHPFAGPDAAFSDAIQYVFHINSSEGFGGEASSLESQRTRTR